MVWSSRSSDLLGLALSQAMSRRDLLRRATAFGVATTGMVTLLAACADDDDEPIAGDPETDDDEAVVDDAEDDEEVVDESDDDEAVVDEEDDADTADDSEDPDRAASEAIVAQSSDPTTLDPHDHRETPTGNVARHIYDPLVDRNPEDPTEYVGVLAESWELVEPTVLEIQLKEGIEFHNGELFDAEVAKYNFDRVLTQLPDQEDATLNAYTFYPLTGCEVIDDQTIQITTEDPDPLLLGRVSTLQMVPLQYTQEGGFEALAREPIGTGAYTFVEWVPNERLVLEANPDYHMGRADIDRVVFRPIPEGATRIAELRAGNVDVIVNVPPDNVPEIEQSEEANVSSVPSARVAMFFLNTLEYEYLQSREVRQALNHAVDVDAIVEHIMGGYALRVATFAPPYYTGHNPDMEFYEFDPDRAREMLADAGYADGFPLEILVPHGRYQQGVEAAEAIAGYLQDVGIDASVNAVEFGFFAETTQAREIPQAMYAAWGNAYLNPLTNYEALVVCGTEEFSFYCNDEIDELYDQAASTSDEDEHVAALQELERRTFEEAPFIFLYAQEDIYGTSIRLNWEPRTDEVIFMYEASITE